MKLYIYEHCPFCSRARMAFGLKEVPVELSVVMANDAETPVRKIGRKALPILEGVIYEILKRGETLNLHD